MTDVSEAVRSAPVVVQISALVRSQLNFSEVLTVADLQGASSIGQVLAKKYRIGQKVLMVYRGGRFVPKTSSTTVYEVGNLAVVRFVKSLPGLGVTV